MMRRNRRILPALLCLCLLLTLLPTAAQADDINPFTDVQESNWYYEDVMYVLGAGLMQGTSETEFSPNLSITRAMLVTVLYRLEGSPEPMAEEQPFSDVREGSWYDRPVTWAAENGIVNGMGGGRFAPNDDLMREQMATIFYRYAEHKGYDTEDGADLSGYPDYESIHAYARDAMSWASGIGLINGLSDGTLSPRSGALRSQVAAVLHRFCNSLEMLQSTAHGASGQIPMHTVTFQANYTDGFNQRINVREGKTVSVPGAPMRDGYAFLGWFTQAIGGEEFDADMPIVEDIMVYAHWSMDYTESERTSAASTGYGAGGYYGGGYSGDYSGDYSGGYSGGNSGGYSGNNSGGNNSHPTPTPAPTATPTPTQTPDRQEITRAWIAVDGEATHYVAIGDTLRVGTDPADATYTVTWMRGNRTLSGNADGSYTVQAEDLGKPISMRISGTEHYFGIPSAQVRTIYTSRADDGTGVAYDVYSTTQDTYTPVYVIKSDTTLRFVNNESEALSLTEAEIQALVPVIADYQAEEATASVRNSDLVVQAVSAAVGESVSLGDIENAVSSSSIRVDLALLSYDANGQETENLVHPVGTTVVTLTREELGVDADTDLGTYVFYAYHTNRVGDSEVVIGQPIPEENPQYVRFVLNGLSRLRIGKLAARTVTTEQGTQKVKFGTPLASLAVPTSPGKLFMNWDPAPNYITADVTLQAIWTDGSAVRTEQMSGSFLENGTALADDDAKLADIVTTLEPGITKVQLNGTEYTASLSYTLTIAPETGATAYALGTTVEEAITSTSYTSIASSGAPAFTVSVTGSDGKTQLGDSTRYVKWVDANGSVLGVQSATVRVYSDRFDAGRYETETSAKTVSVNRGIGRYELYLTGGTNTDFVANLEATLDDSTLQVEASFEQTFQVFNARTQSYTKISAASYKQLKVVITPFAGQSFTSVDDLTVSGDIAFTKTLENGNFVLTGDAPALDTAGQAACAITLSYNGTTQTIHVYLDSSASSGGSTNYCSSWSEALTALGNGVENVIYMGSDTAVLTSALTIAPTQYLAISQADLAIGTGGSLTIQADATHAGRVSVGRSVAVASGGSLTTNTQSSSQSSFRLATLDAGSGISLASGGALTVPTGGYLALYTSAGVLSEAEGASITVDGSLSITGMGQENTSTHSFAGALTLSGTGSMTVNGASTIASTGTLTNNSASGPVFKDGLVNAGTLTCNMGSVRIEGAATNSGTITLSGGRLTLLHTGHTVYNTGSIAIASGATLAIPGTVLENTGSISGDGALEITTRTDTGFYNTGVSVLSVEYRDFSPGNYTRGSFTRDPDSTVEQVQYTGKLTGTGTCTVSAC